MGSSFLKNANISGRVEDFLAVIGAEVLELIKSEVAQAVQTTIVNSTADFDKKPTANTFSPCAPIAADNAFKIKPNVQHFELQHLKSELEQLKKTMRDEISSLNNENNQLKLEMAEKTALIVNMQGDIDRMKKDQLDFHDLVSTIISDAKKKLDDMNRIEKKLKDLEKITSKYEAGHKNIKQNQNIDEIVGLRANLSATKELINITRADIIQLKELDLKNKQDNKAFVNEYQTNSEKMKVDLVLLGEKVEKTKTMIMQHIKVCFSRSKTNFTYTVPNIDQLKSAHYSPPIYARMLPWIICVEPTDGQLSFYLYCNAHDNSPTWSCSAMVELGLKCHKQNASPYTARFSRPRMFNSYENNSGFPSFIPLSKLFNPKNGYVSRNSITLEIYLDADEPQGLTANFN